LLVRVATIIDLGNHEIFKQSILKFDILINSHIVYSNIWSLYLVKVRMSVAILSHISGNVTYNALVQPYFNYCSPLWDNCGIGLKDKLQKFQNCATRMITGSTYDTRSVDVLHTLGWETLDQKRNYTKSIFMYKIINCHAAPNLKQSFRLHREGDTLHDLRNRATDLALPKPKRDFGKRNFKYHGAIHWNNLPIEAKNANPLTHLKGF
jgi:hypothetical protein